MPIIVYNVPSRTAASIAVETLARLAQDAPNIIGIKDASADMTRIAEQRMVLGADFIQLSGDDSSALGFMAHGGHGCISVTANIAPLLCADFQGACLAGDFKKALTLQDRLMPLHLTLFAETSPAPVKYAASLLGHALPELRLPLVQPSEATRANLRRAMAGAGVL